MTSYRRMYTITHEMRTLNDEGVTMSRSERAVSRLEATHRIPQAHQDEQQRLLERSYPAQVDRRQPADGHCADAVEERVCVRHSVLAIARIEDTGHNQRCKGAVDRASAQSARGQSGCAIFANAHKNSRWVR